ncbi:hypothetical protein RWH45_06570 [Microbacterium sp. KSW4-17]|uniref:Uncharacterized protein n=1 Tax=Microbacterium galbum TaxID=3075994 RepID=A0ABU3T669_9MICO|nr:hypothetical protein [Microbacterium sp. KSW4-17]MDU0366873.1 hypothetical protein [Microbacterium sp. KSW4-17]
MTAAVALLFFAFAAWITYVPPAALTPDTSATATPVPPRAEPILATEIFDAGWVAVVSVVVALLFVIAVSAWLRWRVTDGRLEAARQRVGDVTVVSDRTFVEQSRIRHDDSFETPSERNEFLERRIESLVGEADAVIERLSRPRSSPSDPAADAVVSDDPRVLNDTLRALVAPDTVFARITERFTLGDERAEVSLARTVEGSDLLKGLVLVPVLRIRRGSLLGALTLTIDGAASRTLPTAASRGVLVLMLRKVTVIVSGLIEDARKKALLDLTVHVSSKIVSDVPLPEADRMKLLDQYDTLVGKNTQGDGIRWMRSLIDLSLATDVIFAPIPGGCGTTRRLVVTFEEPYRSRVRGGEAHARRFTGIGRDVVALDLLRVAESNSFHLDVTANESSYIEQADVILSRAHGDALASAPEGDDSEYLLVSPLRGDNRVHVYWRDFRVRTDQSQPSHVAPRLELRLRERPPGLLGPTLALSLWMWVITWVVGYFYPVLFADVEAMASAWSTLILAAPALLTGLLLSRLTSDAVRVMSISTFALVIWLSINVAAVVSVAALTLSGVQFGGVGDGILSLRQPAWFTLMFLTGLHLLSCALLFVGRGRRYIKTINERWQQ